MFFKTDYKSNLKNQQNIPYGSGSPFPEDNLTRSIGVHFWRGFDHCFHKLSNLNIKASVLGLVQFVQAICVVDKKRTRQLYFSFHPINHRDYNNSSLVMGLFPATLPSMFILLVTTCSNLCNYSKGFA